MLLRRKITAIIVAAAVLVGVAGCYPSAAGAIDRLREFATTLEGVTGVDSLRDTPENMAFPFGGNALGTAGVRIDGEDWAEHLDEVAEAVRDWLETEQRDEKVQLSAVILVPFGGIGVASPAIETAERASLLIDLAGDELITSARVGYDPSGSVDESDASIVVGRVADSTLRHVVTDWQPRFAQLSNGSMTIKQTMDVSRLPTDSSPTGEAVGSVDGERTYGGQTADTPETPAMQWALTMDEAPTVVGWRVTHSAENAPEAIVAAATIDGVDGLEALARATPGADEFDTLTIVAPGLSVVSEDGPPTGVRTLATSLALSGDYGTVHVAGTALSLGELTPEATRSLLMSAQAVAPATLAFTTTLDGLILEVDGTDADYLAAVVPALLVLNTDDMTGLRLLDDGALWVEYGGAYNANRVESLFETLHDAAIAAGSSIQVTMGAADDRFRLLFDAKAQLEESDVWVGNDTKADDRHRDAIAFWNSLDR